MSVGTAPIELKCAARSFVETVTVSGRTASGAEATDDADDVAADMLGACAALTGARATESVGAGTEESAALSITGGGCRRALNIPPPTMTTAIRMSARRERLSMRCA